MQEIQTSEVVFREDLYPRMKQSPETVQKYAADLSVLPPIEVNQHSELIDGWHRWTAHKKNDADKIQVIITETKSDANFLELAVERNSTHGLQLSQADKKNMARGIYHVTPEKDRKTKKKHLAQILSVSERTVASWLEHIDKDTKELRNQRIFDKWLAGWTQKEIGDSEDVPRKSVDNSFGQNCNFANLAKTHQTAANFADGFEAPIYNVWTAKNKSNSVDHFGNSEQRWLDNLLYLYTEPFDMVIDPFAGGGSTIDVCKKRFRRYFVSDRKPIIEREKEIRQHDLVNGVLKPPQWKDVKLVYLDPPYWKQAEGQYSNDPDDLANMSLEQFNKVLANIIKKYAEKLNNAYIALIIQPTQWRAPDKHFTDHVGDMLRAINLPVNMRFSVPYQSQQYTPQMVNWAKENKRNLVLTREIIVWES